VKTIWLLACAQAALAHSVWAACPSTLTIPFDLSVSASTGTITDSAGNVWNTGIPNIPAGAGANVTVPVTLTPAAGCPGGGGSAFVTGETTLGTLRNNWPSSVGFYILVGSASITITDLGRWVVSGNAGQHVVSIYDSTCKSLGSVTINTSGAPSGAFTYASLGTPVVLSAAQHYYVMSAETAGGDQWYDSNSVLTSAPAASVVDAAYLQGTTCNVGGPAGSGAGHSYGFPSFKFH